MARMQKNKEKGNGEGTIYKSSKTNLYIGQYVVNGQRKSVYQKKNEKIGDFKKRFTNIINSVNTDTYIEKTNETIIEILEKYVQQKYDDGIVSARTYKRDLETLEEIKKTCSNFITKSISKVTIEDIENSKKEIRTYSKNVIDKIWLFLKKGFKIAYSRRKIAFNIMEDDTLKKPISLKKTEKIEALTKKEEKQLLKTLNNEEKEHKYTNIVKLQLATGMRIGEVLARSISDVNIKKNTMHIWNTLTTDENYKIIIGEHTKIYDKQNCIDKGARTISMNKEIKEIVLAIINSNMRNMYNLLFWDYEKNKFISPSEVNSWLLRLNDKYKISKRLSTHVLRHTFITRLQESGVHLSVIQYLVGHTHGSDVTENVYTSISIDFVKQELEKIK